MRTSSDMFAPAGGIEIPYTWIIKLRSSGDVSIPLRFKTRCGISLDGDDSPTLFFPLFVLNDI